MLLSISLRETECERISRRGSPAARILFAAARPILADFVLCCRFWDAAQRRTLLRLILKKSSADPTARFVANYSHCGWLFRNYVPIRAATDLDSRSLSSLTVADSAESRQNADVCWPTPEPPRNNLAKEEFNKSAAIRDLLAKYPSKSPLEIAAAMKAEHKVVVPAQYVSTIKSNMKAKKGARKLTRKGRRAGAVTGDNQAAFFAAAQLVARAGSIEAARSALDAVAKVASIVG